MAYRLIFLTFLSSFLWCGVASSQSIGEVKDALTAHEYDDAKIFIDKIFEANNSPITPEKWFYRGLVYSSIANDLRSSVQNLDSEALFKSYDSFVKYKELAALEEVNGADTNLVKLYNTAVNQASRDFQTARMRLRRSANPADMDPETRFIFKRSVRAAELAQDLKPEDSLAYRLHSQVSYEMKEYRDYINTLEELIDITRDNELRYNYYQEMIRVLRDILVDSKTSLKVINKALEDFPNDEKFVNARLSLSQSIDGIQEKQLEDIRQRVKENPNDPLNYYNLGVVYYNMERFDESFENYKLCLDLDPSFFDAYKVMWVHYFNLGSNTLRGLTDSTAITFTDYQKKGKLIENQADSAYQLALPYLRKYLQLQPEDEDALKAKAVIYQRLHLDAKEEELNEVP